MMKLKARLKCEYTFNFFEEIEVDVDAEGKTVADITNLIDSRFNEGL